jgi:hypothetical protein
VPDDQTRKVYRSNTPKGMPATPLDMYKGVKEKVLNIKDTLGNMLRSKTAELPAARTTDIELLPPGMIQSGNINLYDQPVVKNSDGTTSTVDSSSYGIDGKETLLPSVTPDGRHLRNPQAIIAEFRKTGRHLGTFQTPEAADAYAQQLHEDYANGRYDKSSRVKSNSQR